MPTPADNPHSDDLILGAMFDAPSQAPNPSPAPNGKPAYELVHGREGFGRLLQREALHALVEYFDHPGNGGTVRRRERASDVHRAVLPPQLRVHWQTPNGWEHGRVL